MWVNTSTWEWLKPYVLRSTSLPIENILQLRVVTTKEHFKQWKKARKDYEDWCDHWIQEIRSIPKQNVVLSHQRKIIRRIEHKNPLTDNDKSILLDWHMEEHIHNYSLKHQQIAQYEMLSRKTFEEELELLQQKLFELYQSDLYDRMLYTINPTFWNFYQTYKQKDQASFSQKRQMGRTLFAYLQRVTTKNDTMGEFGPISYGILDQGSPLKERKITQKKAFISHQALQKILTAIKEDLGEKIAEWRLPSSSVDGLDELQRLLQSGDYHSHKWLITLSKIEHYLDKYVNSSSPTEKSKTIANLEEIYTRITGERYQGKNTQYFADKTLVYEECYDQQFMPVVIPKDLWQELDQAILIQAKLRLERWKVFQRTAMQHFEKVSHGRSSIPAKKWISYWLRNPPTLKNQSMVEFLETWLVEDQGTSYIQVPQSVLQEWQAELNSFRWLLSPDLMIAGSESDAGIEVTSIVIGELHHGFTGDGWMQFFNKEKGKLRQTVHEALHVENSAKSWANWVFKRTMKSTPQEYPGLSVELTGVSASSKGNILSLDQLEVRIKNNEVALFIKNTHHCLHFYAPALGFKEETFFPFALFCSPMFDPPKSTSKGRHPSLKVGRVTIMREHWRFEPSDWVGEQNISDWFQQFERLQTIQKRFHLPTEGFLHFSHEQKPMWFDFDNPFCADMFFNEVKKATSFMFTRMDPSPKDLFIKDEKGHYCCELRTFVYRKENSI
ncbi:hypothetical protein [Paenibacillus sp. UASWS1643]|uniref:hypothetical protein n=1 Tax=Paenibacillus sp. UASWS1643 TaxID=2580422 RepID=UPI00123C5EB0|nr:hypothetical protein [Paenibacillus sp. UASWS1643]KAA8745556.1 hypothetical protein FE296_27245 [Paenibacillus sp. UASWS1643]